MTFALVLIVAYLLGSIPTSFLVVYWMRGRDIRTMGTGNPGTMNVLETIGRRAAFVVGLGDIGKGMAAVGIAYAAGLSDSHAILAAFVAVAGHDWSIFLRLRGGNGTGPAVGAMFALLPLPAFVGLAIATVTLLILRSRRIAGVAGLLATPALAYLLQAPDARILGTIALLGFTYLKIGRSEGFSPARPGR